MAPHLENILRDKYSRLFDTLQTPITVGDGWFDLLDDLCCKLMLDIELTGQVCKPVQVKEKWGALRLHCLTPYSNDQRGTYILAAQIESEKVCEVCGHAGMLITTTGWVRARCHEHQDIKPNY